MSGTWGTSEEGRSVLLSKSGSFGEKTASVMAEESAEWNPGKFPSLGLHSDATGSIISESGSDRSGGGEDILTGGRAWDGGVIVDLAFSSYEGECLAFIGPVG